MSRAKLNAKKWLGLWLAFVLCVVVALCVRKGLQDYQVALNEQLRQARSQLTRMQQGLYALQTFAQQLQSDARLQTEVAILARTSSWQTPLTRTRIRLNDAISDLTFSSGVQEGSLLLEPASEPSHSKQDLSANESLPTSRLRLTANVRSVPDGTQLLEALSASVYPYPLLALGCSYQHQKKAQWLQMRCMVKVAAWPLPLLQAPDVNSDGKVEPVTTEVEEGVLDDWRLFSLEESSHPLQPSRQQALKDAATEVQQERTTHGIVTGPKGTLVVREQ